MTINIDSRRITIATQFNSFIDHAEATALPLVHATHTNLTAARELVSSLEIEADEAATRVTDIEASFRRMSDDFTAADHGLAESESVRARLRLEGATADLAKAQTELRYADTRAAGVIASVLRKALPAVSTRATYVRPTEAPQSQELPFLVVVQTAPTTASPSGVLTGEVEVIYFRSNIHRPLQKDAIQEAAYNLGFRVEPLGNVHSDAGGDTLKIRVTHAHDSTPEIPQIQNHHLGAIGKRFASNLAASVCYEKQGIKIDRETGAYVSSHVSVLPDQAQVLDEHIASDGTRTLTIESVVLLQIKKPTNGRPVSEEIDRLISEGAGGAFMPGLGVISSLSRVTESSEDHDDGTVRRKLAKVNIDDLPTNAAVLGFENAEQIVLRATVVSRTAAMA